MPWVSGAEWDRIQKDRDQMTRELQEWELLGPFLRVARQLQKEVVQLVESDASTAEVGRLAFMSVLADEAERARKELAVQYEQRHRKELYTQTLATIEEHERDQIEEAVRARLETDAALAKELRDSARRELTTRAKGVIASNLTNEQQGVIDAETERQIALDRLDVSFALTGHIGLTEDRVTSLLRPGDKLVVLFERDKTGQCGLGFKWAEDINGAKGWTMGDPVNESQNAIYQRNTAVRTSRVPSDRFVVLGSQIPDLVNGEKLIRTNALDAGYPLALSWQTLCTAQEASCIVKTDVYETGNSYAHTQKEPPVIAIDFQTHDLIFPEQYQA
jgi:hypothetical protein